MRRLLVRNEDYSPRVGVRKATVNVVGNAVIAATPATFIVMVARYNHWAMWPIEGDAAAAATLMTAFTGITRWFGDWYRVNVVDVRYEAQQAADAADEGE